MNPVATFFIKVLEVLFVIGALGSLAVVAVSMVEDTAVIFEKDEPTPTRTE